MFRAAGAALLMLIVLVWGSEPANAAQSYRALSLELAIERLRADGLDIFYSSDLVKPWMQVRTEPEASEPRGILTEILKPYDLGVEPAPDDGLVIVRARSPAQPDQGSIRGLLVQADNQAPVAGATLRLNPGGQETVTAPDGRFEFRQVSPGTHRLRLDTQGVLIPGRLQLAAGEDLDVTVQQQPIKTPDLAEIVVSASRYELFRHTGPSASAFTAADLDLLPEIGDDGLRAITRLPGTASVDISAKANVRGGEEDETLVRFDGMRLYNPFHLKDFQSLFSSIDPSLIEEMNIYTGGFPVNYGDRMSSVIDIKPLAPGEEPFRELSLSFFNASALATGNFNDGKSDWLVSARRGNLDLVFDVFEPDRGSPYFVDVYTRVGHRFNEQLAVSGNLLIFDDKIKIFDDDKAERAKADYQDKYFWLRLDIDPAASVEGSLHLARLDMDSKRRGTADQEGVSTGSLNDERNFEVTLLQTDWSWRATDRLLVQAGGELRDEDGDYDYQDDAEFAVLFLTPGASLDPIRSNDLSASPNGRHFGLYTNLRLDVLDWMTTEVGLRWDKETLTQRNDEQFSPRASVLVDVTEQTSLRLSWGRFFQAQSINELQISDGVTEFFQPQRSDHWIVGLEHAFGDFVDLRVEAFRKEYRDPRPRYENLLNTLIVLPELKPDRVRVAPDKATAEGIEVSFSHFDNQPLSWWLSYTWSSIKDDFGVTERPRHWDQNHTVTGGTGWRTPRWEFSLTGTYHRGWATTDAALINQDPIPLAGTGPRNGDRLNYFRSVDVRVARNYDLGDRGRLTIFGQLNNMFSWKNDCCIDYELEVDEDTGFKSLDIEKNNGIPVVPSLGVTWQF